MLRAGNGRGPHPHGFPPGEKGDHFDSDLPVQRLVPRLPDLAHAALAKLPDQPVTASQKLALHRALPVVDSPVRRCPEPLDHGTRRRAPPATSEIQKALSGGNSCLAPLGRGSRAWPAVSLFEAEPQTQVTRSETRCTRASQAIDTGCSGRQLTRSIAK